MIEFNGRQQMAFEGPIFVRIVTKIQEETLCNEKTLESKNN
jgi:hypothetical protein